ncbi:hypothetical protein [Chryseobacterium sp.]|uniref:hypothetical protein n=1 Tax=Chryseobacterium sp. TaxID=1871047 RepID=UPI0031D859F8
MKTKTKKSQDLRQQIMKSAVASFKIEGIKISAHIASDSLKKVEAKLRKSS